MAISKALLVFFVLGTAASFVSSENMVCYFSSWAVYRPLAGRFDVDDLDPNLCTHAVFGFAGLSNRTWTIEVLDPWNENCANDNPPGNNCAYQRFVALKQQNPKLKAILAVGGWNEGSEDYSTMVADPMKRRIFIDSCIKLVQKEGFDGLDIDWEYPTLRGGAPADKENFITLLDEFRAEFNKYNLIMTAALASGKPTIDDAYNTQGLIRNLDIMSIMTYDFHGAWENFTHHNAPLCGYPSDEGQFVWFNVVASINYWISLGAPKEKLVMGIPLYGRCFTLNNIENHGMLADASRPGKPGPYTRLPGTQGYNEICERIKDTSDCTVVNDPILHEPYMYCKSDKLWCGYDDAKSVEIKANFAKWTGLGGAMVWTVDTDDFKPNCGEQKFVLINTIKRVMNGPPATKPPSCDFMNNTTEAPPTEVPTTDAPTTEAPTTNAPTTEAPTVASTTEAPTVASTHTVIQTTTKLPTPRPTTQAPLTTRPVPTTTMPTWTTVTPTNPSRPNCTDDNTGDVYAHEDCNKYWTCVDGSPLLRLCAPGTFFNPTSGLCDFPENTDTSHCRTWVCVVDGTQYPGVMCNEYYVCEHGEPVQKLCTPPLYYNPKLENCDNPGHVNTNNCNAPMSRSYRYKKFL